MGIPSSGAYVGAAVGGNQAVPQVETQAGGLAIHRTYYNADQVDYAITRVKDDLANGRLPWISFKLPYSWADMAAGRGDSWVDGLADRLAGVGGPVWLAFHHEPEGDGNMQDWVRMQQHLAPIIHARTNNVAYTVIYTGWDALFGAPQYHLNAVWPGDQYVDILGIDMYNSYGARPGAVMLDPMKFFSILGPFARQHHVGWALGETAFTKAAAQADPNWLNTEYKDLLSEGGLALTYFDSSLNSIADWTLDDPIRMNAFRSVLSDSVRLCR